MNNNEYAKPDKNQFSGFMMGGVLVGIGILFLLGQIFHIKLGRFMWPFYIIIPGVLLFIFALTSPSRVGEPLAVLSSSITMVGLILLYQNITNHWASWAYAWTLITPTSIGLGQLIYGSTNDNEITIKTGKQLTGAGFSSHS